MTILEQQARAALGDDYDLALSVAKRVVSTLLRKGWLVRQAFNNEGGPPQMVDTLLAYMATYGIDQGKKEYLKVLDREYGRNLAKNKLAAQLFDHGVVTPITMGEWVNHLDPADDALPTSDPTEESWIDLRLQVTHDDPAKKLFWQLLRSLNPLQGDRRQVGFESHEAEYFTVLAHTGSHEQACDILDYDVRTGKRMWDLLRRRRKGVPPQKRAQHGTRSGYQRLGKGGKPCSCDPCRAANAAAARARNAA